MELTQAKKQRTEPVRGCTASNFMDAVYEGNKSEIIRIAEGMKDVDDDLNNNINDWEYYNGSYNTLLTRVLGRCCGLNRKDDKNIIRLALVSLLTFCNQLNLNQWDSNGNTPISSAISYAVQHSMDDSYRLQILLNTPRRDSIFTKLNVNHRVPKYGDNPINLCILFNSFHCFKILLSHPDIDVNMRSNSGDTPLIRSFREECCYTEKFVLLLLRHPKVNVNLTDNENKSAFRLALEHKTNKDTKIISAFAEHPFLNMTAEEERLYNEWLGVEESDQSEDEDKDKGEE